MNTYSGIQVFAMVDRFWHNRIDLAIVLLPRGPRRHHPSLMALAVTQSLLRTLPVLVGDVTITGGGCCCCSVDVGTDATRLRNEQALRHGRVVKPGAGDVILRTENAAAMPLHNHGIGMRISLIQQMIAILVSNRMHPKSRSSTYCSFLRMFS